MSTFLHSGDCGDIIYTLPAMIALGGGKLYLAPHPHTRVPMTEEHAASLLPLLGEQPCLESVAMHAKEPIDYDFNLSRKEWIRFYAWGKNLSDQFAQTFNVTVPPERWLRVRSPVRFEQPHVVFSRSGRYQNPLFPWKSIRDYYAENAIFVGLESEWKAFEREVGYVPWVQTPDLNEVARLIAGASLFVGNQSCPYAIAEGLKVNTIQETWTHDANCMFPRPNAQFVSGGQVDLTPIADLHPAYASIGVVSLYAGNESYAPKTAANKRAYCARHAYGWHYVTRLPDPARHPSWNKIRVLLDLLPCYDWLFWTDADTLILDMARRLEHFIDRRYDLLIGTDWNGINAGNFIIRNCPRMLRFLRNVYDYRPINNAGCWEQPVMAKVLEADRSLLSRVKLMGDAFNTYPEAEEVDFLVHFANQGGKRDALVDEWGKKVQA